MSHDDYIILSPDSQNESNIRPPMKPYPVGKQNNMLPQRRQREFCWPFSCCCKLFSKNNKSSNIQENEHSDDSLLFETECPPKSSHQPLHHHTEISNNYSPCDGFNSIKECDSESDSTEEEHNSEDDNENQEPEEYDYPGSDLQNAIALSLQVYSLTEYLLTLILFFSFFFPS